MHYFFERATLFSLADLVLALPIHCISVSDRSPECLFFAWFEFLNLGLKFLWKNIVTSYLHCKAESHKSQDPGPVFLIKFSGPLIGPSAQCECQSRRIYKQFGRVGFIHIQF